MFVSTVCVLLFVRLEQHVGMRQKSMKRSQLDACSKRNKKTRIAIAA